MTHLSHLKSIPPTAPTGVKQKQHGATKYRAPLTLGCMFGVWIISVSWIVPYLVKAHDRLETLIQIIPLGSLVAVALLAWLYALYNIFMIAFAMYDSYLNDKDAQAEEVRRREPSTPVD